MAKILSQRLEHRITPHFNDDVARLVRVTIALRASEASNIEMHSMQEMRQKRHENITHRQSSMP